VTFGRQQSGHEPHPHSHPHPLVGAHVLSSSRALPPSIHVAPGSHGLSQYPSSQYDGVKVEEDYMVGSRIILLVVVSEMVDFCLVTDAGIVP
jgi:hypothetical protein